MTLLCVSSGTSGFVSCVACRLRFPFFLFFFAHRRDAIAIASTELCTTNDCDFRFDSYLSHEIGASGRCRDTRQQLLEPVPTSCLPRNRVQQFLAYSKNQSPLVSKNLAVVLRCKCYIKAHIDNWETISMCTRRKRILLIPFITIKTYFICKIKKKNLVE